MKIVLICVLLITFYQYLLADKETFKIGALIPTEQALGVIGVKVRNSYELWRDTVNARGGLKIDGKEWEVQITFSYVEKNVTDVSIKTSNLLNQNPDLHFLLLPWSTLLSVPAAVEASSHNINALYPATSSRSAYVCDSNKEAPCTSITGRRFSNVVGLTQPASLFMENSLNLLKLQGVETAVVFWEDNAFTKEVATGAIDSSTFIGIKVVFQTQIAGPSDTLGQAENDVRQLIKTIQALEPDIVVGGVLNDVCVMFMRIAKELNFNAKAFLFSVPCMGDNQKLKSELGEDSRYMVGAGVEWDERVVGDLYSETDEFIAYHHFLQTSNESSPALFHRQYIEKFGVDPEYFGALGYTAGYVIQNAFEIANTTDPAVVQDVINTMDIFGFGGGVRFDIYGRNIAPKGLTYQVNGDQNFQLVAPLFAATAQFVYPSPRWDERQITYGWYNFTSEKIIVAFTSAVIFASMCLIIWVIIYREHRIIRASQPLFVAITLFGSILVYCTVFFWTLHTDGLHCTLRRWTLAIGFGTTYGALFARTYRIAVIFLKKTMEIFKVTNWMIIPIVGVIIGIEVIILLIWTIVSIGTTKVITGDIARLSDDYIVCEFTKVDVVFAVILLVFNVSVLCYGMYWVFRIWNLKSVLYNESKFIGFAVYTLAFFVVITLIIQFSSIQNREVEFVLRSLCLILGPFISVLAILVPKMYYMARGIHSNNHSESNYSTGTRQSRVESETIKDSTIKKLKQRISELEKRNRKLESESNCVGNVKSHVDVPAFDTEDNSTAV